MKVSFQQTGGIVATKQGCTLDSDALDTKTAAKLKRLVEKSGVASGSAPAPASASTPRGGAPAPAAARDVGGVTITVETEKGKSARLQFTDVTMPDSVRPLVKFLRSCSKPLPFR